MPHRPTDRPRMLLVLILSLVSLTTPTHAQEQTTPPLIATLDNRVAGGRLLVTGCQPPAWITIGGSVGIIGVSATDPYVFVGAPPLDYAYRFTLRQRVQCVAGDGAVLASTLIRGAHQRILPVVSR